MMCLQESKMQSMSTEGIRSLSKARFLRWVAIDVKGTSGALVVFWDSEPLQLLEINKNLVSVS